MVDPPGERPGHGPSGPGVQHDDRDFNDQPRVGCRLRQPWPGKDEGQEMIEDGMARESVLDALATIGASEILDWAGIPRRQVLRYLQA